MGDFDKIIDADGERRLVWPDWSKVRFSRNQAKYIYSDNPLKIVMAGRGFGKDFCALWEKTIKGYDKYFARRDGRDLSFRRPGLKYHLMCFAGEKKSYEDNINKLHSILPRIPGKGIGGRPNFYWNNEEQRFELFGLNQFWISMFTLYGSGNKRGPGGDDILVTEAQAVSKNKFMSVVMPMTVRGGYGGNLSAIGTGNCGWFDDAYEQAQRGNPDEYFGNWAAFDGTSFDNPDMTDTEAKQALREYLENPSRFQIERLGLPNIILRPEEKPECPFHEGMVANCLTMDRLTIPPQPLVIMDLQYGGADKLCRGIWDKNTHTLPMLDFYEAKDLGVTLDNPYVGLTKFFIETNQMFPGCTIAYDAQGRYGGSLQLHVPAHIKLLPMTRTRPKKNTHVENVIERMSFLGSNSRSAGLRMPHPDAPWLNDNQRKNFQKLLTDLYHYRRVTVTKPNGETDYYYTKGEGYEDDGPDMLSWSTEQLRPMNKVMPNVSKNGRAFRRGLYL